MYKTETIKSLFALSLAAALVTGCSSGDTKDPVNPENDSNIESSTTEDTVDSNVAKGWKLVWSEEFAGDVIDPAKWGFEQNCWGGGNGESQCYTNREKNAYVEDGILTIAAIKEEFSGPAEQDDTEAYDPADTSVTKPYTSARMRTKYLGDWKYGRIEVRAKPPTGQGSFPAIWMLPTDWEYGGWAASGEIDIAEWPNLKSESDDPDMPAGTEEARIYGTLHYGQAWPNNEHSGANTYLPGNVNPADEFHVYAIEWEEGEIRWYVDDLHYATQTSEDWYSQYVNDQGERVNAPQTAPYDQRFHLILNNAVGGSWVEAVNETGIDTSIERFELQIDYVRVYQCTNDTLTGKGCATINPDAEDVVGHQAPEILTADDTFGIVPVLSLFEDDLHEQLVYSSYNPDGAVSYSEIAVDGRGEVLEIAKDGANGNVYFEHSPRADLSQWMANGFVAFDLNVVSKDDAASLDIKLDSGWPAASPYTVTLPALNTWTEVSVPLADILANENPYSPGNYADPDNILNLLVFEPNGPMKIQLDNIRYETPLNQLDEVVVFADETNAPFGTGQYVASGSVEKGIVEAGDPTYGQVVQIEFNTDESVVYFQALTDDGATPKFDFSRLDNLEFDLLVVEDPRSSKAYNVKMDCGHPCGSGDFAIDPPEIGVWTHYRVALSDLVANAGSTLDLTNVDTPLVIFPAWGDQQGVVIQVDNVRLTKNL